MGIIRSIIDSKKFEEILFYVEDLKDLTKFGKRKVFSESTDNKIRDGLEKALLNLLRFHNCMRVSKFLHMLLPEKFYMDDYSLLKRVPSLIPVLFLPETYTVKNYSLVFSNINGISVEKFCNSATKSRPYGYFEKITMEEAIELLSENELEDFLFNLDIFF